MSQLIPTRAFGSWRRLLSQSGADARDLFFPPACFACGASLPDEVERPHGLCQDCFEDLSLIEGAGCWRCGAPATIPTDDPTAPCGHCQDRKLHFDEAIAAGVYEGLLRELVLQAKHAGQEAVAMGIGRLMWRRALHRLVAAAPDVVASTPMHWRRRLVRQTNSPELMGEVIARRLNVPFAPRLLKRRRATHRQPTLARGQRFENVRNALAVRRGHRIDGATIVLIDDILTTGATCSEAARALKRAGAERVVVVVAARSL